MKTVRLFLFITLCFLLGACGEVQLSLNLMSKTELNGSVQNISGLGSSKITSSKASSLSSCLSINDKIQLYSLTEDGEQDQLLQETTIDEDGSFSFKAVNRVGLDFKTELENTSYGLFYVCGDKSYQRFVTGPEEQIVSESTTLFSWLIDSGVKDKVHSQEAKTWEEFYQSLTTASSQTEAFSILNSDDSLKEKFQTNFGVAPTVFLEVPPKIIAATVPQSLSETGSHSLSAQIYHWSADYDVAYSWRINSTEISQNSNFNYVPSANSQGQYTLRLFVGKNAGGGVLDTSEPYTQQSFQVTIQNNLPATAPEFTLLSSEYTNSTTASVRITTGALIDGRPQFCHSFSKMALVEESFPAVGLAPSLLSSYDIDCDTANAKDLNFNLSGAEGRRTLRLWAMDASGNTSLLSEDVTLVYDNTAPSVSLTTLNETKLYRGGEVVAISWNASDENLTATPVTVEYSSNNGSSWTSLLSDQAASGSYNWTLPSVNSSQMRVRITAEDEAGHTSAATSTQAFEIDSTAPSTPAISLSSATPSQQRTVTLSITCDADYEKVHLSESSTAPAITSSGWIDCAGSQDFEVSSGDGIKTIYVWSKDEAQNLSASAQSVSMTLDQTAPAFSWVTNLDGPFKGGEEIRLEIKVTETHITSTEQIGFFYSNDGGTNWTSIATVNAANGPLTNQSFTYDFSYPSENTTQFRFKAELSDSVGNQASSSTSDMILDSTPPSLSSVILNNGDDSTSFSFIQIKVDGSDNLTGLKKVRFADTSSSADCQSLYQDSFWMSWTDASTALSYNMSPVDGNRKICVWAQDEAGNVSVLNPSEGTLGVNSNLIDYFVGNPPVITSLSARNASSGIIFGVGDPVYIDWALSDVEGLSDNPLDFYVSVNGGEWSEIATDVGGLSGNPTTASGTYSGYSAPNGVFRIKAVATDTNNNTSIAALSSVMNSEYWSVYMGSSEKGVGGKGTSLSMFKTTYGVAGNQFAMNPVNGDIYAVGYGDAVYKLDAQTGKTSIFIKHGSSNFSEGKSLDDELRASTTQMAINFDPSGRLYISNPESQSSGGQSGVKMWQLDFDTNTLQLYAGGGSQPGLTTTLPSSPTDLLVGYGSFDIDNNGAMYIVSGCDLSQFVAGTRSYTYRILRINQNPDGSAGNIEWLAGDCSSNDPVHGAEAKSSGLSRARYRHIRHIAVNGDGSLIYVAENGTHPDTYKIAYHADEDLRRIYHTSIGNKGLVFDRLNNQLFAANGNIYRVELPADPADAESMTEYVSSSGTGDCNSDGVSALSACINAYGSNGWAPLEIANDGSLLFTDNMFRIRYIDSTNSLRTLMGTQPFYGEGLHRSLARGNFTGIHYKAGGANTTDYPVGLYFIDDAGGVLGYVDPGSGIVSIVAGNQQQTNATPAHGSVVSRFTNLGPKGNSRLQGLTFDGDGLPIFYPNGFAMRLTAGKVVERIGDYGGTYWQYADPSDDLNDLQFNHKWVSNLTMFGTDYMFGLGVQTNTLQGDPWGGIGFVDFSARTFNFLMKGLTPSGQASSADSSDPATVNTSPLASICRNDNECFLQFNSSDSYLYFSEDQNIRRLTSPTNPAAVELESPVELAMGRRVRNFAFSPDNKRVYYLSNDGDLYCQWLGGGTAPSNCLNTSLGPGAGFAHVSPYPNQITFIEDGKILISSGAEIYQYVYTP